MKKSLRGSKRKSDEGTYAQLRKRPPRWRRNIASLARRPRLSALSTPMASAPPMPAEMYTPSAPPMPAEMYTPSAPPMPMPMPSAPPMPMPSAPPMPMPSAPPMPMPMAYAPPQHIGRRPRWQRRIIDGIQDRSRIREIDAELNARDANEPIAHGTRRKRRRTRRRRRRKKTRGKIKKK